MSFSGMVKEELSRQISPARHCRIAETAALLCACGRVTSEETSAADRKCSSRKKRLYIITKTFNIETEIAVRESRQMKKGNLYYVEISNPEEIRNILQGTKLSISKADGESLCSDNSLVTQQSCCKRAFIRGAFLASGSISDPEKGYHFEIVCPDRQKAEQLQELIRSFQIDAKIVLRKNHMWSM